MDKYKCTYTAFKSLDGNGKLVHLQAEGREPYAQFVYVERASKSCLTSEERSGRGARYFLTCKAPLTEDVIKGFLAQLNCCRPNQVDIKIHSDVWLTVGRAD